jgi:hypothetical protein
VQSLKTPETRHIFSQPQREFEQNSLSGAGRSDRQLAAEQDAKEWRQTPHPGTLKSISEMKSRVGRRSAQYFFSALGKKTCLIAGILIVNLLKNTFSTMA